MIIWQCEEKSLKVSESPGKLQHLCDLQTFASSVIILFVLHVSVSYVCSVFFFPMFAVRSAKFIPRENWIVAATDDKYIRVYNYDKMEKIVEFEEHKDYIRSLAVHPFLPYVVSASDDQVLKVWNWKEGWSCVENFEGHSHYVMQVAFNPQDPSTFASASLDGTLKV